MKVFDKDGIEYDKEPVDCCELVADCGWSFTLPVAVEEVVEEVVTESRRRRPRNG